MDFYDNNGDRYYCNDFKIFNKAGFPFIKKEYRIYAK